MADTSENTKLLLEKLEALRQRQEIFQNEIEDLQEEIRNLAATKADSLKLTVSEAIPSLPFTPEQDPLSVPAIISEQEKALQEKTNPKGKPARESNLENFIGANLINYIGITVTVLGVGIGAKYAIDHELISPLTRIMLGYPVGIGLLGFALKLKKKYHNFSAVLLSGAMAIFYFLTFAAYSFYSLFPVLPTFIVMVLITGVTVGAAIFYNRQAIAHIGLVGAYAVPFLLDTGSGRVEVLFAYMTIINTGILIVSIKRYWKPILYSSFILTWLIFLSWYVNKYDPTLHFATGLAFASIFFVVFYLILMGYKLIRKEVFEVEDILLLLANSGIFYGLGYSMLRWDESGIDLLGLYTLGNGGIHFAFWGVVYLKKQTDKTLLYFIGGLVVVFLTIAIPVQLDGRWVTLLWAFESALLFYLGRAKNMIVFEWLSYPLIFLMAFSLCHDWVLIFDGFDPCQPATRIIPVFNINFFTSAFVSLCLGMITWVSGNKRFHSSLPGQKALIGAMNVSIPALLIIILYFSFYVEILNFLNQLYAGSKVNLNPADDSPHFIWNEDIRSYRTISILMYSLIFFSLLSIVNNRKIHSGILGIVNLLLSVTFLALSLTFGLIAIGELRESFMGNNLHEYYYRGSFHLIIRYPALLFIGFICYAIYDTINSGVIPLDFKKEYDFLLHIALLTIASNELIGWMDLAHAQNSYKLGLSILFGCYSLILIVLGILQRKKHLRIGAMVLFGVTLIKLFVYDLQYLDTISKTIIFLALGLLLLIISFLYNKYAVRIFDEHVEQ